MSDDSDYDAEPEEFDIYKKKCQLLAERCEVLQQDNERLVHRIQLARKLLKRTKKEKKYLIDRLDKHGDNWRETPLGIQEENSVQFQTSLIGTTATTTTTTTATISNTTTSTAITTSTSTTTTLSPKQEKVCKPQIVLTIKEEKPKKAAKKKSSKADPSAPKRPANPFFQFCQEQRPRVMERLAGEPEPSKQELTRQLATTWKSLSSEDKKVYYDMYERSKEKYVAEMQIYNKKVEDAPLQMSLDAS